MPPRRRSISVGAALAALAVAAAGTSTAAARPTAVGVHLSGRTSLVKVVKPTVLLDRGTITGSPVGRGSITLVYRLRPAAGIATVRFAIVGRRGRVTGRAVSRFAVNGPLITFTGTAALTGGSRAYRGIRGRPLEFGAVHSITGRREVVTLTGRATLP